MWGSKGGSGLTYPGSLGIHVLSHEGTAFVVLQKPIVVVIVIATVCRKKLKNLPHEQQSMKSFPSSPLLSGNSSVSSMTSLSSLPTFSSLSASKESPAFLLLTTPLEAPKEQKRCLFGDCKKKLAFSDFACRCGTRFCATHRAAEEHKCTHDWKAEGKKTLGAQLGSCVNAKLERI